MKLKKMRFLLELGIFAPAIAASVAVPVLVATNNTIRPSIDGPQSVISHAEVAVMKTNLENFAKSESGSFVVPTADGKMKEVDRKVDVLGVNLSNNELQIEKKVVETDAQQPQTRIASQQTPKENVLHDITIYDVNEESWKADEITVKRKIIETTNPIIVNGQEYRSGDTIVLKLSKEKVSNSFRDIIVAKPVEVSQVDLEQLQWGAKSVAKTLTTIDKIPFDKPKIGENFTFGNVSVVIDVSISEDKSTIDFKQTWTINKINKVTNEVSVEPLKAIVIDKYPLVPTPYQNDKSIDYVKTLKESNFVFSVGKGVEIENGQSKKLYLPKNEAITNLQKVYDSCEFIIQKNEQEKISNRMNKGSQNIASQKDGRQPDGVQVEANQKLGLNTAKMDVKIEGNYLVVNEVQSYDIIDETDPENIKTIPFVKDETIKYPLFTLAWNDSELTVKKTINESSKPLPENVQLKQEFETKINKEEAKANLQSYFDFGEVTEVGEHLVQLRIGAENISNQNTNKKPNIIIPPESVIQTSLNTATMTINLNGSYLEVRDSQSFDVITGTETQKFENEQTIRYPLFASAWKSDQIVVKKIVHKSSHPVNGNGIDLEIGKEYGIIIPKSQAINRLTNIYNHGKIEDVSAHVNELNLGAKNIASQESGKIHSNDTHISDVDNVTMSVKIDGNYLAVNEIHEFNYFDKNDPNNVVSPFKLDKTTKYPLFNKVSTSQKIIIKEVINESTIDIVKDGMILEKGKEYSFSVSKSEVEAKLQNILDYAKTTTIADLDLEILNAGAKRIAAKLNEWNDQKSNSGDQNTSVHTDMNVKVEGNYLVVTKTETTTTVENQQPTPPVEEQGQGGQTEGTTPELKPETDNQQPTPPVEEQGQGGQTEGTTPELKPEGEKPVLPEMPEGDGQQPTLPASRQGENVQTKVTTEVIKYPLFNQAWVGEKLTIKKIINPVATQPVANSNAEFKDGVEYSIEIDKARALAKINNIYNQGLIKISDEDLIKLEKGAANYSILNSGTKPRTDSLGPNTDGLDFSLRTVNKKVEKTDDGKHLIVTDEQKFDIKVNGQVVKTFDESVSRKYPLWYSAWYNEKVNIVKTINKSTEIAEDQWGKEEVVEIDKNEATSRLTRIYEHGNVKTISQEEKQKFIDATVKLTASLSNKKIPVVTSDNKIEFVNLNVAITPEFTDSFLNLNVVAKFKPTGGEEVVMDQTFQFALFEIAYGENNTLIKHMVNEATSLPMVVNGQTLDENYNYSFAYTSTDVINALKTIHNM